MAIAVVLQGERGVGQVVYFDKPGDFSLENVLATNLNVLDNSALKDNFSVDRKGSRQKVEKVVNKIASLAAQAGLAPLRK